MRDANHDQEQPVVLDHIQDPVVTDTRPPHVIRAANRTVSDGSETHRVSVSRYIGIDIFAETSPPGSRHPCAEDR